MSKNIKAEQAAPKATKAPKTVKLTTIIWTVSVLVALGAGFYSGITARSVYADSVKAEAQALVSELKTNEQQ
ncbi:MAG: hypothetical protein EOL91_10000 [Actinobacteria bacterium]|nr:hypothetical protein [Actinomycetota bacterium]